jgi:hypothetical protein
VFILDQFPALYLCETPAAARGRRGGAATLEATWPMWIAFSLVCG